MKLCLILFAFLISLLSATRGEVVPDNGLVIAINQTFAGTEYITPFISGNAITGLTVSADIALHSDTALVRIILTDVSGHEYLVFETYPLLAQASRFSIEDAADETRVLGSIIPASVRFEIIDAEVYLKSLVVQSGKRSMKEKEMQAKRQQDKITLLNSRIAEGKLSWLAGETYVSKLSFQEKMELFRGRIPNFQGFEYYAGGIFALPGSLDPELKAAKADDSLYADEFSWRSKHGEDWATPVRNQWTCGSCWAFAAAGATELLINLYYNRHIDFDLSEQELVSCVYGNCIGGSTGKGLSYIQSIGLVNESCFPYVSRALSCREVCKTSPGRISISSYTWYNPQRENLKKFLIHGPVALSIGPWNHAMVLVGYRVIHEGDKLYKRIDSNDEWVTVGPDDPLIGKTCWQMKNSWGPYFGEDGYANIILNMNDVISTYCLDGAVVTNMFSDADVRCTDKDNDGYYNWGLGNKPAGCPASPDLPDGDDSDPCLGPIDAFGNFMPSRPRPPVAEDVTVPLNSPVIPLHAEGKNIRWFGDSSLVSFLASGNDYITEETAGLFTYYATQGNGNCESSPKKVTLKIMIPAPETENVSVCEGHPAVIYAQGQNIRWYRDSEPVLRDKRDGQAYETVVISGQKWMAGNLDANIPGSVYYLNDSMNYHEYGRLYTWESALNACPQGWNIPTDIQFKELEKNLGMSRVEINKTAEFRGTIEGNMIKESGTRHWNYDSGASDETGLSLLPAGYARSDMENFDFRGERTFLWSRTGVGRTSYAMSRIVSGRESGILRTDMQKNTGLSVRCLADSSALTLVATGESFIPGDSLPGRYNYYVSQEIGGLESDRKRVSFSVDRGTFGNLPDSIEICSGMRLPSSTGVGEYLHWYNDSSLAREVDPGQLDPGFYTFYAVMENLCGTSAAKAIHFNIKPLPVFSLGKDTTLNWQERLLISPGETYAFYHWNDGSTSPYYEFAGEDLGSGTHFIRLMVTDSNHCTYADTLFVTVQQITSVPQVNDGTMVVYPNPGNGYYAVYIPQILEKEIHITVTDLDGKVLLKKNIRPDKNYAYLDLSSFSDGLYILRIENSDRVSIFRLVKN